MTVKQGWVNRLEYQPDTIFVTRLRAVFSRFGGLVAIDKIDDLLSGPIDANGGWGLSSQGRSADKALWMQGISGIQGGLTNGQNRQGLAEVNLGRGE